MSPQDTYALLDSGDGARLEQVGPYRFVRPAPQAFWRPALPKAEWERADGIYHRSKDGGGSWEWRRKVPESWPVTLYGLTIPARPTGFGHLGFFAEQEVDWRFLTRALAQSRVEGPPEVMNLFGYTGLTSLVLARAGAHVCHLDASKGVVAFARENAESAGLGGAPIRWMVEDATKFLQREERRGHRYHGLTLSPPSFGRGSKGEVWKIEEQLPELLSLVRRVLHDEAEFVTLNTNSPKFSPQVLVNLLQDAFGERGGQFAGSEMLQAESSPRRRLMPNGAFAAWWRLNDPVLSLS